MGPDLNMRVSDAERAEVADRLARHFADGRLDQVEFDERVSRAMAAKTVGDLRGLFDDLPDLPGDIPDDNADDTRAFTGPGRAAGMSPAAGCTAARRHRPMRGPVRTLVLVALILAAANVSWHLAGFWVTPLAWLVIIAAIIVAVSRHGRRSDR
jgi:hypothetical protein